LDGAQGGLKVKGAAGAEEKARRLILKRHPDATRILFRRIDNMGTLGLWRGKCGLNVYASSHLRETSNLR
jgi:hypothetical protein